jgi:hypothetical protein
MTRRQRIAALLSAWLLVAAPGQAQLPELPAPRPLPDPGLVLPQGPIAPPPLAYPRVSSYAVWQYYAPDSWGVWRPRVILPPGGHAYYLYNGKPYPWVTTTSSRVVMPFAVD